MKSVFCLLDWFPKTIKRKRMGCYERITKFKMHMKYIGHHDKNNRVKDTHLNNSWNKKPKKNVLKKKGWGIWKISSYINAKQVYLKQWHLSPFQNTLLETSHTYQNTPFAFLSSPYCPVWNFFLFNNKSQKLPRAKSGL